MARRWCLVLPLVLGMVGPMSSGASGAVRHGWAWPVVGPVMRGFDPPEDPYGAGHRGIDIGAPSGTPVRAPAAVVVTFAGKVGGQLFLTLDHGSGLTSTCSWLSALLVRKGDVVAGGASVALTGWGHPGAATSHLHFGVRLDGAYVDPLELLGPLPVWELIHLAPLLGPLAA